MPRVYVTLGDRRRCEHITALFTKDEKDRVMQAARAANIPASILIHRIVLRSLEAA